MKKLLSAMSIFFIAFAAVCQDKDIVPVTANLIAEGLPAIPQSLKSNVQLYSESRGASFVDWHPVQNTMLVATRFGNTPQLHQVKMPLGSRKQLTFFEDAVAGATYEPKEGKYFIFSKDQGGNEFGQLYRYDVATGKTTLITDGGRSQNGGIKWNNAGDRVAFSSTKRNGADRDVYLMDPTDPASAKMVLELKGGGWGIADWSPDDKKLLLLEYISANESHIWMANLETKDQSYVTDAKDKNVSNGNAKFSKSGKGMYYITDKDNEFKRLAYMDLAKGTVKFLTDIPWDVEAFEMSEDGQQIAFVTNEAGESKLYLMQASNNLYKKIESLPAGLYGGMTFHPKTNALAVHVNNARSATDVYVIDINSLQATRWTESEMGGMVPEELALPSLINWKSFDDKEITGFYFKPASRFTGKRPVVISIHGGPEGQSRPGFQGANNYFLNEMGVAIIYPNVRGSSGYGKTFIALDNGFKREESVKDIGALLDWVAKQPELDADRIMVMGGSYGGYMSLAVSFHYADRIRCAIDIVGISNFNTFLKNTESYRRDLRRVEYGDERDSAMSRFFEKIAPLNNVDKIKKPLFIVQGGNDPRVPRTEAVQMADKIRTNNGMVWYLEAKDEGHGFRKKNNADFQRLAMIMFMKKYLLGEG